MGAKKNVPAARIAVLSPEDLESQAADLEDRVAELKEQAADMRELGLNLQQIDGATKVKRGLKLIDEQIDRLSTLIMLARRKQERRKKDDEELQ